jgi:serine/threonine protein kinase
MPAGSGQQSVVALVVGVGKYRSTHITPLRFASRDARAMFRLLTDPEICGLAGDQIALLTDRDARRRPIVEHLSKWLPERSRGADLAVIYFACHGIQQELGSGEEGYLIPYDADPDKVVVNGIAMAEVAHLMNAVEARAVVMLLDCCHAGHVLTRDATITRSPPRDVSITPVVFEKLLGRNRFLIAACDKDQKSIEPPELKHGLFTYHLLKGMEGAADADGDGRVGVYEFSTYVSQAVARDAPRFGHVQTPWAKGEWKENVFLSWSASGRTGENPRRSQLERLWKELGPDGAMAELERTLPDQDETWLRSVLAFLQVKQDPVGIPFSFRCLAHPSSVAVRRKARTLVVEGYGWNTVREASAELAQAAASVQGALRIGFLLDGLQASEGKSEFDVPALLEHLANLLKPGKLKLRATNLLEHKRHSRYLDEFSTVLSETHSRYRVTKVLGSGTFTVAYQASQLGSGKKAVLRVLKSQFVNDDTVRSRFYDVSDRSSRYVHQNLALTRDFVPIPERQIYDTVRDLIEGVTLRDVLAKDHKFEPLQALEIMRQTLEALTPVHLDGSFHGGIKPSNVFLCGGERAHVVLGDLGLGLVYLHIQRLAYDYRYAAPEIFRGGSELDPRSDFYALGCLGYELLCGAPPFTSDRPSELMIKHQKEKPLPPSQCGSPLGPDGDAFFQRLLAKPPALRFQNVVEAVRALDALRSAVFAPSGTGSAPVALLGDESLAEYDPLHSIVILRSQPPKSPSLGSERLDAAQTKPRVSEASSQPAAAKPVPEQPIVAPPLSKPSGDRPELDERTWNPPLGGDDRKSGAQPDKPPGADAAHPGSSPEEAAPRMSRDTSSEWDNLPPPVFEVGQVVFDKYELLEKLGEGGMGDVWRVRHTALEAERALKLIKPQIARNYRGWNRFRREAQLMAKIQHPCVVAVYDFKRTHSMAYIEMEYVPGKSLHEFLKEQNGQPMSLEWVAQVLEQLCAVLQEAHGHIDGKTGKPAPIIHRDLKPSNLMLVERSDRPGEFKLKVLDFGIAKIIEEEGGQDLTGPADFLGTPVYMSPEQIRWGGESINTKPVVVDRSSDLYSTGILLYHLLTGTPPFRGNKIALLAAHLETPPPPMKEANPNADVPPEVEAVVRWCLEKDPGKRPKSARILADRFRDAVAAATRRDNTASWSNRIWSWLQIPFRRI